MWLGHVDPERGEGETAVLGELHHLQLDGEPRPIRGEHVVTWPALHQSQLTWPGRRGGPPTPWCRTRRRAAAAPAPAPTWAPARWRCAGPRTAGSRTCTVQYSTLQYSTGFQNLFFTAISTSSSSGSTAWFCIKIRDVDGTSQNYTLFGERPYMGLYLLRVPLTHIKNQFTMQNRCLNNVRFLSGQVLSMKFCEALLTALIYEYPELNP